MNCSKCNNIINKDSKFCGKCGNKIEEENLKTENIKEKRNIPIGVLGFITGTILFSVLIGPITKEMFSKSETEIINEAVELSKNSIPLPNRIDEMTSLVDITAEPKAIRYHYLIDNFNGEDIPKFLKDLKKHFDNNIYSVICDNEDYKYLLEKNISLEYLYTVKNSSETFFTSITKDGCLNHEIPLSALKFPDLQPIDLELK